MITYLKTIAISIDDTDATANACQAIKNILTQLDIDIDASVGHYRHDIDQSVDGCPVSVVDHYSIKKY
jgi:hypothetical protein